MVLTKLISPILLFGVIVLPIILFGIAISMAQKHNDDTGRGFMAGNIICLILYVITLGFIATNQNNKAFAPFTYFPLLGVAAATIDKYR